MGSPPATDHCAIMPVVMLTLSLRSIAIITTGYSKARPLGETPEGDGVAETYGWVVVMTDDTRRVMGWQKPTGEPSSLMGGWQA